MFKAYTSASAGLGATGAQSGKPVAVSRAGLAGWEPSSLYMLGLVIAEVVAVAFLTRHLLRD